MSTIATQQGSRFTFATQKIPVAVKYSLRVIIRDDWVKADGNCALCIQAFVDGRRDVLPLNIYVSPDRWDKDAQRVVNHEKKSDLNLLIRKKIGEVNDILLRYRMMELPLSREKLRDEFLNPSSRHDFYKFWEKEMEKRKRWLKPASYSVNKTVMEKLRGYRRTLKFSDVTTDFLVNYEVHLRKQGKKTNTIWKYMKTIRSYVLLAVKEKILQVNPFTGYKWKQEDSERVFLDENELQKLISYFLHPYCNPNHQRVLRYFLFSCFTGLRISDVKRMTVENVIGSELVFYPQKTDLKLLRIPLGEFAKGLIVRKEGKLFDAISDQKTNKQLKQIASRLELRKRLTFHVARHTFATLMLTEGGSIQVVQRLLGHSKIQTTLIYAHITDRQKREHVTLLDNIVKIKSHAI